MNKAMKPYYEDSHVTVYNSDALTALKAMPSESIDMCMTSPPYWMQRNYHIDGQLGLERTFTEYIDKLIAVFDEIKRILKKTGTCWVNIDDSYSGSGGCHKAGGKNDTGFQGKLDPLKGGPGNHTNEVIAKSLIGIPERFVIAMIDHGWIRRNTIIFYKPNCMPESVKDRFTNDFEFLYFFSKQPKYYFEQQFEPQDEASLLRAMRGWNGDTERDYINGPQSHINKYFNKSKDEIDQLRIKGRNMRTVWKIVTEPSGEDHYAAYPEKLCETPILAGCPSAICTKCGKAREKVYERQNMIIRKTDGYAEASGNRTAIAGTMIEPAKCKEIGLTDCGCGAEFIPGTVLDPFAGTGTTGAVAKRLGRKAVLIELNPKYCKIIKKRISNIPIPMKIND